MKKQLSSFSRNIHRMVMDNLPLQIGLITVIVFCCIIAIGVLLLNFTIPFNKDVTHNKHTIAPIAVSYFKVVPKQNAFVVLDKSIPSTGCNATIPIAPGATTNMGITMNGGLRTYLVYFPSHYTNTKPHAIILSFHGYASNDEIQQRISHLDTLADMNNFLVVYPQGTTGALSARGWNTGLHPTITANDVLFVSNILNQLQANLCINQHQIYATGFSNGGGFVGKLACKLSNRIAAFAPISGSYLTAFASCTATRPVPIIEFHGTADRVVPYNGLSSLKELATQAWLKQWAKKDGCADTPTITQESENVTQYAWTMCHDNAAIVHYKISGGHHVWPHVQFRQISNGQVDYVNTIDLIWDFFRQHPLAT